MATTTGQVRASGPVLHPRICAALTAVSCAVHLWLAASGHHQAWLGILMIGLAAVCVPCTVHIWRHSRVGALHQVTVSALAMVGLHAVLLLSAGGAGSAGGSGHAHGGGPASSAVGVSGVVSSGAVSSGAASLLLVIGLEITTALLAATLVARLRRSRTSRAAVAS
ncbi:hypothetical protein J2790_003811 [Paenarthrobacter nicotinovorans]|uniref:hypothetical protein n=1 Tax=Micrococcaceae TaxID=1268 RepID=UPI0008760BA0|nr:MULTISPECIES: hypothetical protein [Micrococcaceae]MDR6438646.1 hypothetical protein [Paenarthrobacter nicotinovorans]SCZ59579.1 hypothetical protein SAMN02799638_02791 [Arthrobacter sp. UNCCL28]